MTFAGFPKETSTFLKGIAANNEKAWFEAHRDLYEAGYVAPARAFVEALGPKLKTITAEVKFEPKINGSISRINRDVRFSKDKRPYKDSLGVWFWTGEQKSWNSPGFWFHLNPKEVLVGVGMYMFEKDQLESFRQSVVHPRSGKALLAAVEKVKTSGLGEVGGKTRKLMPRGFETDAERADYLLYEGLYTSATLPIAAASKPDFVEQCYRHYAAAWPIGQWLAAEIPSG